MNPPCLFHMVKSYKTRSVVRIQTIVCLLCVSATLCAQATYVNFEGKQTSPIRLSPDGTRLFAVNTPDARFSVFDVTQPSNPRLLQKSLLASNRSQSTRAITMRSGW